MACANGGGHARDAVIFIGGDDNGGQVTVVLNVPQGRSRSGVEFNVVYVVRLLRHSDGTNGRQELKLSGDSVRSRIPSDRVGRMATEAELESTIVRGARHRHFLLFVDDVVCMRASCVHALCFVRAKC